MSKPIVSYNLAPRTFSKRLKVARINAGLSIRALAQKSGYGFEHLARIERAPDGYNSQIMTVFDLAQALEVSPGYLLGLEDHHGS